MLECWLQFGAELKCKRFTSVSCSRVLFMMLYVCVCQPVPTSGMSSLPVALYWHTLFPAGKSSEPVISGGFIGQRKKNLNPHAGHMYLEATSELPGMGGERFPVLPLVLGEAIYGAVGHIS